MGQSHTHAMRIVYLHGFASSSQSGKAQFFRRQFAARGIEIEIPELDQGNFTGLTITGQLAVVERTVAGRPAVLMGSSLGGYLAALFAAGRAGHHRPPIEKLILMAPAFGFPSRWRERYGEEEMARWKRLGAWPVFHYGHKTEVPLGYQFVEDSLAYPDEPRFPQPALIFHGRRDPVVPVEVSQAYAAGRANVALSLFDSGHELNDVLEEMWRQVCSFLELPARFQNT